MVLALVGDSTITRIDLSLLGGDLIGVDFVFTVTLPVALPKKTSPLVLKKTVYLYIWSAFRNINFFLEGDPITALKQGDCSTHSFTSRKIGPNTKFFPYLSHASSTGFSLS